MLINSIVYIPQLEACLYGAYICEQVIWAIFQYAKFHTSVCNILTQRAFLRQTQHWKHTNTKLIIICEL